MKRFLIVPSLLAMALVQSNCAKTEVGATYEKSDNLDVVTIQTATAKNLTRAYDAVTSSLEAMDGTTGTLDVLILSELGTPVKGNQTLKFKYDATDGWAQKVDNVGDEVIWSAIDYPSRFYSLFTASAVDAVDVAGTASTPDGYSDGGSSCTLAKHTTDNKVDVYAIEQATTTGNSIKHQDLVFATVRVAATPSGGAASMVFSHVLSKIDILASTTSTEDTPLTNNKVEIQSVKLINVNSKADFQADYCQTDASGAAVSGRSDSAWGATSAAVDYGYVTKISGTTTDTNVKTTISGNKAAIVDSNEGYSMMIIPQSLVGPTVTTGTMATLVGTESYIEVIYHGITSTGGAFAGEVAASDSWNYITAAAEKPTLSTAYWNAAEEAFYTAAADGTKITTSTEGYFLYPKADAPLYVKVAFPFADSTGTAFAMGKYYNIILGMGGITGSTGGYLLDQSYYDAAGNKLPLEINNEVLEVGDQILPDASGAISIVVKVTDWDETSSELD